MKLTIINAGTHFELIDDGWDVLHQGTEKECQKIARVLNQLEPTATLEEHIEALERA